MTSEVLNDKLVTSGSIRLSLVRPLQTSVSTLCRVKLKELMSWFTVVEVQEEESDFVDRPA